MIFILQVYHSVGAIEWAANSSLHVEETAWHCHHYTPTQVVTIKNGIFDILEAEQRNLSPGLTTKFLTHPSAIGT